MIQLHSPDILLEREKLVKVDNKNPNKPAQPASYKLALVFNYPQEQLPATLQEMVEKLVAACRFKPDEAIYINQGGAGFFSLNQLTAQFNIKYILAFGNISLSRNMAALTKHLPYQIGGVKIIQTESLENLEKNATAKKELWGVLMAALNLK